MYTYHATVADDTAATTLRDTLAASYPNATVYPSYSFGVAEAYVIIVSPTPIDNPILEVKDVPRQPVIYTLPEAGA